MPLQAGTRLGPFEILFPLGAGGMGEVYRARDSRLGREVALKVLPADLSKDREGLLRFAQEARSASSLNHPNIITMFEVGQSNSLPYYAMELIDGEQLSDVIGRGSLSVRRTLDLAAQIADGLAKAHEKGIVHRDLKPDNLMITKDGFVKILDFGIAKLQSSMIPPAGQLTQTGIIMGTPDYMSPEQAAGRPLDFRSDQFSLGLICYEMLTHHRPFHRPTAVQTLSAIIQEEPEPLGELNPRVPIPLVWVIDRCLAKDPEGRYASTQDLSRELRQIRENLAELGGDSRAGRTGQLTDATFVGNEAERAAEIGAPAEPMPAAALARPKRGPWRRVLEFVGVLLLAVGLFAGGGFLGHWLRGKQGDLSPLTWRADLLLGAMSPVMAPRVSADGRALAFVTLVGSTSHVAVMKPTSGDWAVLTRKSGPGSISRVCWSRDGNKLYFDRVSDIAHGIFSIPPLGGEERLVLENAQAPEALPDGSLLVVQRDAARNFQLHRFWPETGRITSIGPSVVAESSTWGVRAFPDGRKAIFWGKRSDDTARVRRIYVLDLATGQATPFARDLPIVPPLAVAPDGKTVFAFLTIGDLQQAVSISADTHQARMLFPVTAKAWGLDAAFDGTMYVSTMDNPAELLRFPAAGGVPDRVASTAGALLMSPVQFPDGGLLLPSQLLGRRRLLVAGRDGQLRPFLDVAEQATPPAVLLGETQVAFLSGGVEEHPRITIASIAEGRVLRRLDSASGAAPQSMAASPDGKTLFYIDAGSLYSVGVAGGNPVKLRPANGVAVDSRAPASLVVQVNEPDGVRLYRALLDASSLQPIPLEGTLRPVPDPISPTAVGPDGRVALAVTSRDSWTRGVGLLDPATGALERVPVAFDGNLHYPAWGRDGNLLAMGVSIRSSLWRFQAQPSRPD